MRKLKTKKNSGQVTIEYLFSFIFSIGIFIFFIQLGLNISSGFLVHYATYMASRTYLVVDNGSASSDSSDSDAEKKAVEVFAEFNLKEFGVNIEGDVPQFNRPGTNIKNIYVGARSSFKTPMTAFQLMGGTQILELESESFLGREPTKADCYEQVCKAVTTVNKAANSCERQVTLFDNGC